MSATVRPVSATEAEREKNANLAKLEGCVRPHSFAYEAPRTAMGGPSVWRCGRCGGTVGGRDRNLYCDGLADGRREASSK